MRTKEKLEKSGKAVLKILGKLVKDKMYLLDSNILIGFLNGSQKEINWVMAEKQKGSFLGYSVISRIETLSLYNLSEDKIQDIENFFNIFNQAYLSDEVISLSAKLRRNLKLSLGDAIVVATAISKRAALVTNDKALIKKIKKLVNVLSLS